MGEGEGEEVAEIGGSVIPTHRQSWIGIGISASGNEFRRLSG